jgi:hypothetical protein
MATIKTATAVNHQRTGRTSRVWEAETTVIGIALDTSSADLIVRPFPRAKHAFESKLPVPS